MDDAAHTSDLVLLPEASFMSYHFREALAGLAEPVPGPMTAIVSQIAVVRGCYICYSTVERDGDAVYDTAILVSADGSIAGRHRKVRLTAEDIEAGFSAGEQPSVLDTHLGRVGILICEDLDARENTASLRRHDAQLILVPCTMVAMPDALEEAASRWGDRLSAVARETGAYLLCANRMGGADDAVFMGNSMILDPHGGIVARGGTEEEVVRARISL
jgi:predicted amidohydrolase